MTWLFGGGLGAAIAPYMFWIKLAGAVLLVGAIAGGGWYARGVFDKPVVLAAQLDTAQCRTASQTDRANGNAAAAGASSGSIALAFQADAGVTADLEKLRLSSQSIMENVNAEPNGQALGSNPALGTYLNGLRAQAAAAH